MNLKRVFATEVSRKRAIFLLRAESGLLLTLVTYLIIAPLISDVSAPAALTAEIVFGSLGSVGLWYCANGFKNGKSYGRAPAVLANLIAIGVSYYMVSGGFFLVGIPLSLLALITLLSALFGYSE